MSPGAAPPHPPAQPLVVRGAEETTPPPLSLGLFVGLVLGSGCRSSRPLLTGTGRVPKLHQGDAGTEPEPALRVWHQCLQPHLCQLQCESPAAGMGLEGVNRDRSSEEESIPLWGFPAPQEGDATIQTLRSGMAPPGHTDSPVLPSADGHSGARWGQYQRHGAVSLRPQARQCGTVHRSVLSQWGPPVGHCSSRCSLCAVSIHIPMLVSPVQGGCSSQPQ